ncbi:DUF1056 family protein [Melissococcus plutonius]|uniref:DUF1056 family protein n=1 Tax=Melissococcus plutonius TaxID=33970 RepID=UPI003C2B0F54
MIKLVFKIILKQIGKYFDVICFIVALLVADYAAFLFGKKIGYIAIAVTLVVIGWLAEIIAGTKDKGGEQ